MSATISHEPEARSDKLRTAMNDADGAGAMPPRSPLLGRRIDQRDIEDPLGPRPTVEYLMSLSPPPGLTRRMTREEAEDVTAAWDNARKELDNAAVASRSPG